MPACSSTLSFERLEFQVPSVVRNGSDRIPSRHHQGHGPAGHPRRVAVLSGQAEDCRRGSWFLGACEICSVGHKAHPTSLRDGHGRTSVRRTNAARFEQVQDDNSPCPQQPAAECIKSQTSALQYCTYVQILQCQIERQRSCVARTAPKVSKGAMNANVLRSRHVLPLSNRLTKAEASFDAPLAQ